MMKSFHLLALVSCVHLSVAFQSTTYITRRAPVPTKTFASRPWWKPWGATTSESEDITTSKVFLQKKLESMQKQKVSLAADLEAVKELQAAEDAEWSQPIKSLQAEFANLQQRSFNESRDADNVARASVVKELLPVLDNFERAKASLSASDAAQEAIVAYYGEVFAKVDAILDSYGMTVVPSLGSPFDYNIHEAIQQVPSDEYAEDVVCQEFQKGYMIGEMLVRPAVVAVSIGSM